MACRVEEDDLRNDQEQPQAVQVSQQVDYDFVEQPSQDFFCPVTLELLIDPHQTTCCGNHLSQEAANRLQRDGKPCPMCKKPQLATVPDLYFKRKVNEINKVRCLHKKSGCEWVGGANEVKQHSDSCPKRPWQCQYCEFASTYEIGISEHVPKCTKYPVVCPNSCEIVSVPRCDLEAHLMVCPLRPVACEYAEVGCNVKVPRRDLARHMEESQQQHLLSATLLNLRLTRENTEEKKRMLRMIEEKDKTISDLQTQLEQVQDSLVNLQQQVVKYREDTQEHLSKQHEKHVECLMSRQTEEKNRLFRMIEEKDRVIQEKENAIEIKVKAKDKVIAELQSQLKQAQERAERDKVVEITEKAQYYVKKEAEFQKELALKDQQDKGKDRKINDLLKQLKQMQEQAEENMKKKDLEKSQQLKKKETECQKMLAIKDQHIKQSDATIKGKGKVIADLQKELKQMLEQVEDITKKKDEEKTQELKKKETECQKELAVRDQGIKERDETIKEKDNVIADLQKELKRVQESLEAKIANLQQQVVKYGEDTQEHLKQQDRNVEHFMFCQFSKFNFSYIQQGFTLHEFTLTEFKKCQAKGGWGDWYSEPFYTHPGGYTFKLNVHTNGCNDVRGIYVSVWFLLLKGDHDDKLGWPVTATAHTQLLNQLGDHNHHEKTSNGMWKKRDVSAYGGRVDRFIKLTDLELNVDKNTLYLKNDCLYFRVYIKAAKT